MKETKNLNKKSKSSKKQCKKKLKIYKLIKILYKNPKKFVKKLLKITK